MDVKEAVLSVIKELILPELRTIQQEQSELKITLQLTNRRIDDMNSHLSDQSRRIDEINQRIDRIHSDIIMRTDTANGNILHLYEVIVRRDEFEAAKNWAKQENEEMKRLFQTINNWILTKKSLLEKVERRSKKQLETDDQAG